MTTPIEYTMARQRIDRLQDEAARRRLTSEDGSVAPSSPSFAVRRLVADARQRLAAARSHADRPSHA